MSNHVSFIYRARFTLDIRTYHRRNAGEYGTHAPEELYTLVEAVLRLLSERLLWHKAMLKVNCCCDNCAVGQCLITNAKGFLIQ